MKQPVEPAAAVFGRIYRSGAWHPNVRSGIGSAPVHTRAYRELLQRTIRDLGVTSVVDLGCGDWNVSGQIDWRGVDYLGLDVVVELIDTLRARHGGESMRFECADLIHDDPPAADLAICKDVLQHWPNAAVRALLDRLHLFRYALLTNDVEHDARSRLLPWRRCPIGVANEDIDLGDWRPLRLLDPPFELVAEELGVFEVRHGIRRWRKQVLLWTRPER